MRASGRSVSVSITGLALALALAPQAPAGDLSLEEARGKQIYIEGTSARGEPIWAYVGANKTRLPGAAATCASCHGPDGRGRPEAGVIPSDVTWSHLFKPYGHSHPMGRGHPAFTIESLKASILSGRDPAGNALDASMPTYAMAAADVEDLLAYMRRLESDLDPGLSDTVIRLGTLVPADGRLAEIGEGIQEALAAYFDQVNSSGGIYGRRLELIVSSYDEARRSPLAAAEELLAGGAVFALVSPVVMGADAEIGALVEEGGVPTIGPVTLLSPDPFLLNDFTFYLFSGLREQVRVLVDFAAGELELKKPRLAALVPADERYRDVVAAIEEQGAVNGWGEDLHVELLTGEGQGGEAAARRLQAAATEVLFYLGAGDLGALLEAGDAIGWRPRVLLPGAFVKPEILDLPASFQGRVHLAYPTLPADQTGAGMAEVRGVLEGHGFALRHRTSQVSAFVAAKILVEALQRAGRDLSRDKLLRALEKLFQLDTGLTPQLSFGVNRHIGAPGAYVVAVDLEKRDFVPVGGFLTPRAP